MSVKKQKPQTNPTPITPPARSQTSPQTARTPEEWAEIAQDAADSAIRAEQAITSVKAEINAIEGLVAQAMDPQIVSQAVTTIVQPRLDATMVELEKKISGLRTAAIVAVVGTGLALGLAGYVAVKSSKWGESEGVSDLS